MNRKIFSRQRLLLIAVTCISASALMLEPANAGGHGGPARTPAADASVSIAQLQQRLLVLEARLEKLERQDVNQSTFRRLPPSDKRPKPGPERL